MHKLVQCYWRSKFILTEVIQWLRCMFCTVWWILYIPDELTCRDFKSTVTITTDWTGFIYCILYCMSRILIFIDRKYSPSLSLSVYRSILLFLYILFSVFLFLPFTFSSFLLCLPFFRVLVRHQVSFSPRLLRFQLKVSEVFSRE